MIVHHLNNSRSHRILWLLEEIGLDYELKVYQRTKSHMAPRELREVHPLGKSPVITDDGRVIAESAAIIEYIIDIYGNDEMRPPLGTDDYFRYRYWMHYAEGSAATPLLVKFICNQVRTRVPFPVSLVARKVADGVDKSYTDPAVTLHMGYWEAELGRHPYFVGDNFTAADIQMSYPVAAALSRTDASAYSNIAAYVDRISARPAYERAVARGGPAI